jgi:hypothetical protein
MMALSEEAAATAVATAAMIRVECILKILVDDVDWLLSFGSVEILEGEIV